MDVHIYCPAVIHRNKTDKVVRWLRLFEVVRDAVPTNLPAHSSTSLEESASHDTCEADIYIATRSVTARS